MTNPPSDDGPMVVAIGIDESSWDLIKDHPAGEVIVYSHHRNLVYGRQACVAIVRTESLDMLLGVLNEAERRTERVMQEESGHDG